MILVLTFPNHCVLHTISHLIIVLNNETCITAIFKQMLGIEMRRSKKKCGTEIKSKTTHRGHPSTAVIKGLIN